MIESGPGDSTARRARILFNYRHVIDCTICELSGGGACLEMTNTLLIPDTFDLITDREDNAHVCRVIWRDHGRMGVAFQ